MWRGVPKQRRGVRRGPPGIFGVGVIPFLVHLLSCGAVIIIIIIIIIIVIIIVLKALWA